MPALRAEFDLTRRGAGVHVSGRVQAQVGQTCVVSLEPIENAVDETVEVLFTPGAAAGGDELAAEPGVGFSLMTRSATPWCSRIV